MPWAWSSVSCLQDFLDPEMTVLMNKAMCSVQCILCCKKRKEGTGRKERKIERKIERKKEERKKDREKEERKKS